MAQPRFGRATVEGPVAAILERLPVRLPPAFGGPLAVPPVVDAPALPNLAPRFAQGCLSQQQIRQAISSGRARPFSAFIGSVQQQVGGQVLNASLCGGGGGLVYRVNAIAANGQVVTVTVDALSGRIQ